ncbi:MAG: class I SAM-dependent methyltransferase [Betaproteobacteria bacterium]
MGVYDRWILPRLTDLAMRNREATRYRSRAVPQARGRVLEIGAGSGLNLPFYGSGVESLTALDPSAALLEMASRKAKAVSFPVIFENCSSESIPADASTFDTVVSTWTLCTRPDPLKALEEMKRVLKPGGTIIFVEHGLAPEKRVREWQQRLNPLWRTVTGGCNLNREIAGLVRAAGFTLLKFENEYAKGLRPMSYIYSGVAKA